MQPGPPRPASATASTVLLFVFIGIGGLVLVGGAVAWGVVRGLERARTAAATAGSGAPGEALPAVTRRVPHHAVSILDGCSDRDVQALVDGIDGAISVGAPLYNGGNFAGCYHMYEGTAADLERQLSTACIGPVHALETGRSRAATLSPPSAQAWAMRDAFDGLLDVVGRSGRAP
jgi:hypothetical protein